MYPTDYDDILTFYLAALCGQNQKKNYPILWFVTKYLQNIPPGPHYPQLYSYTLN